jgi:hypothetical protein
MNGMMLSVVLSFPRTVMPQKNYVCIVPPLAAAGGFTVKRAPVTMTLDMAIPKMRWEY